MTVESLNDSVIKVLQTKEFMDRAAIMKALTESGVRLAPVQLSLPLAQLEAAKRIESEAVNPKFPANRKYRLAKSG